MVTQTSLGLNIAGFISWTINAHFVSTQSAMKCFFYSLQQDTVNIPARGTHNMTSPIFLLCFCYSAFQANWIPFVLLSVNDLPYNLLVAWHSTKGANIVQKSSIEQPPTMSRSFKSKRRCWHFLAQTIGDFDKARSGPWAAAANASGKLVAPRLDVMNFVAAFSNFKP